LSERSNDDDPGVVVATAGLIRYGSTGSISSIGSGNVEQHNLKGILTNHGRQATYTPSSLYSQDSSNTVPTMYFDGGGKLSSAESVLIYDTIPKASSTLKKSNSRVSSTGKLRLRVESFRNNKNSSGTQTDISVVRKRKNSEEELEANNNNVEAKYTGQYKKHTAPHKPARKHKPKSNQDPSHGESRSDRSASPDNSSTSGYSSPSAGLHSKESSPCGSKIPSPPHSLEQQPPEQPQNGEKTDIVRRQQQNEDAHDDSGRLLDDTEDDYEEEAEDSSRITVIQIEGDEIKDSSSGDSNYSESSTASPSPREAEVEQPLPPTFVRQTRRELPRIATNGTLGRPQQPKRRLPDRSQLQPPPPDPNQYHHHQHQQQQLLQQQQQQQRLFHQQQQRFYRSNLPRPAPIHQFGPSSGRVPLPPVPELERSDHERESMSPTPSVHSAPSPRTVSGGNLHATTPFRPLPSPLTTPVQPAAHHAIGRVQPKPRRVPSNNNNLKELALPPSRIPRASSSERDSSPIKALERQRRMHQQEGDQVAQEPRVDERLKVLLSLLENGKEDTNNGERREDTLQYLSQLETVARRLKDQLLKDTEVAVNSLECFMCFILNPSSILGDGPYWTRFGLLKIFYKSTFIPRALFDFFFTFVNTPQLEPWSGILIIIWPQGHRAQGHRALI
jgi:hypothetical protein